jgi:selenocysteine-specific elongation factor
MAISSPVTDLILGTAGHIDHGKTALIRALTGTDTDRLPEEKKRGITIELGFAELLLGDVRLGIVDVPGHERFVRNMLAGATGIDLALLVVAADDSVKPQTREHLEILRLLKLNAGVIALTKCDLADPQWIELVEAEVRELVTDTFLSEASVIRTSAVTGLGLDPLRDALSQAAQRVISAAQQRQRTGPFRMAIDRAFTITGHGTVVTGSVQSGEVQVGATLVIEPGGVEVRVRGLQNHDRVADAVHRGQRAAINLAGVHHGAIRRGQELASPGHLVPATRLTARIDLLASAPRAVRSRARVRLHLGTAESMARLVLLESDTLRPGQTAYGQLLLNDPVVATWGQPLVLRSESPITTIGGGMLLDPNAPTIRRGEDQAVAMARQLASTDPIDRASAALFFAGWRGWQPDQLPRTAGITTAEPIAAQLLQRGDLVKLPVTTTRQIGVHRRVLAGVTTRIEQTLARFHATHPLQSGIDQTALTQQFDYVGPVPLVTAILDSMATAGQVVRSGERIGLAGHGPRLSAAERRLRDALIARIDAGGLRPPSLDQLQADATKNRAAIPQLAELAAADGILVKINDQLWFHRSHYQRARDLLRDRLARGQGLTLSEIREILDTTRKYAVPLCEHFDQVGFTRREGDLRVLAG